LVSRSFRFTKVDKGNVNQDLETIKDQPKIINVVYSCLPGFPTSFTHGKPGRQETTQIIFPRLPSVVFTFGGSAEPGTCPTVS